MADMQATRIDDTLATFERAVFSPVLAGELVDWARRALASLAQLKSAVVENAKDYHAPIFETIADSDPEMFARVQKLQAEDDAILKCLQETLEIGKTLPSVGIAVERDEERASNMVKGFVKATETLAFRLKKQEIAIDVWLQESQTRVRGVKG